MENWEIINVGLYVYFLGFFGVQFGFVFKYGLYFFVGSYFRLVIELGFFFRF